MLFETIFKMKQALLILFIVFIHEIHAENECVSPWQKVDDNICLFLTSVPKTWSHGKFLCNFYGGDLLYIKNQTEQDLIQNYLSKLIKYRFNKKPYVWLDAIDKSNDGNWVWSKNNESITYTNWMNKKIIDSDYSSNGISCACFKLKDGLWNDCECSLSLHFVCRKSEKPINLDILMPITTTSSTSTTTTTISTTTTSTTTQDPEENALMLTFDYDTTTMQAVSDQDEHEDEEYDLQIKTKVSNVDDSDDKRMIISTRVLLDEEDKLKEEILKKVSENSKDSSKLLKMKGTKLKSNVNQTRTAKYSTNTLRIVIEKDLSSFKSYFCPFGFGYYLNYMSGCSKYTTCEDWDSKYAIFSQYECSFNKIFNTKSLKCVPLFTSKCDSNAPIFVSF